MTGQSARVAEAKLAIAEGRIEDRFNAVQKAAAIVDALHACLDFERGGDIARLLDRLYIYVGLRLQAINTANDPALCDEVIARLGDLREAWNSLVEGQTPTSAPRRHAAKAPRSPPEARPRARRRCHAAGPLRRCFCPSGQANPSP